MNAPHLLGVARPFDNPRSVLLCFDRPLTDDELRQLHEHARGFVPGAALPFIPQPSTGVTAPGWMQRWFGGVDRGDGKR